MSSLNIEQKSFLSPSSAAFSEVIRRVDVDDQVTILTLNRPNQRNALSLELLDSFLEHLEKIAREKTRRVLILNGNGKNFCSGLDLREAFLSDEVLISRSKANFFQTEPNRKSFFGLIRTGSLPNEEMMSVPMGYWMPHRVLEILYQLKTLPQIVIGAVHGTSCGSGAGIISACDYVVASENFQMSFPELLRGLTPALLHPFLCRKLTSASLRRLLLMTLPIDAASALEYGVVQEIVPMSQLLESAMNMSKKFCVGSADVAHQAKSIINQPEIPPLEELQTGLSEHWKSWQSSWAKEGIAAFLEKRLPNFDAIDKIKEELEVSENISR